MGREGGMSVASPLMNVRWKHNNNNKNNSNTHDGIVGKVREIAIIAPGDGRERMRWENNPKRYANRRNTSFRSRATDRHRTILTTGVWPAHVRDWWWKTGAPTTKGGGGGGSAWQVAARIDPHRLYRAAPYFSELRPSNETRGESGYCGHIRNARLWDSRFDVFS